MKGIPRIKEVTPKNDLLLLVKFDNGILKHYDVKPLLTKYPIFQALENPELFKKVVVGGGGFGIVWNEEIDLSEYEIWYNGTEIISNELKRQ